METETETKQKEKLVSRFAETEDVNPKSVRHTVEVEDRSRMIKKDVTEYKKEFRHFLLTSRFNDITWI